MNEPEDQAQPRWMQGKPVGSSQPRWMQGKPVGEPVGVPSSNGVPVAAASLNAAPTRSAQTHAQAPTTAPVAAPSAEPAPPAAPAAPRFGQPGYNPLLHGGGGKPPLDLRINRALGIKDYRDEGPPTSAQIDDSRKEW
ncbi:MAG TPA: hypothetical protein P5282_11020, partial [Anaerolineaceae bacterium]|nr:hypothetical protein [Anaerolineaceae bacterium]